MAVALSALPPAIAFTSGPAFARPRSATSKAAPETSSTVLHISSWGQKGPAASTAEDRAKQNPEEYVQAYLQPPESVEQRAGIDGTALVTGLVRTQERTDQTIFNMLNNEESAFDFKKIVAFVDDVAFAKKRLLSRSARYTGLLSKLDFAQAESPGALPSKEQLDDIAASNWVAVLDASDGDVDPASMIGKVKEIAALAQASSVHNVAILLAGANELDAAASKEAVEALKAGEKDTEFTIVAVGKLENHAEGKMPYKYADFGTEDGVLPADAVYSRDEAMRLVTECLQLECGANKALTFTEVNDVNATEARLIKGLREAGYMRPQEIDHMIRVGPGEYQKAIDEFKEKNPRWKDGYYETEAWWLDEEFLKSVGENPADHIPKEEDAPLDPREEEIEKIAVEWVKREYFRQSMAGTIENDMDEEEFAESVWDRALFEAELKYRELNGENPDSDVELANFKAQQERKKQTMLQKAKEELTELLEEEDLAGDDLQERLAVLKAEDDNTEK